MGEKSLANIHPTEGHSPAYVKNSQNQLPRKQPNLKVRGGCMELNRDILVGRFELRFRSH